MRKSFQNGFIFFMLISMGLTACQVEPKYMNKNLPDPTKFGLGISSMKTRDDIDHCLRNQLFFHGIKLTKQVEIFYSRHSISEYHLKEYREILRVADRKGKRQLFFTYDPQRENHRVIFDIVMQCIN